MNEKEYEYANESTLKASLDKTDEGKGDNKRLINFINFTNVMQY